MMKNNLTYNNVSNAERRTIHSPIIDYDLMMNKYLTYNNIVNGLTINFFIDVDLIIDYYKVFPHSGFLLKIDIDNCMDHGPWVIFDTPHRRDNIFNIIHRLLLQYYYIKKHPWESGLSYLWVDLCE